MKKIFKIKETLLAATLCITGVYNLSAQTQSLGGPWGDPRDLLYVNGDYSNNYGQLRLNSGISSFSFSNYGSRLGIYYQYGNGNVNNYSAVTESTTDLFTILHSGYIGIGTNSPLYKLHINGDLRIETAFSMGGGNDFNIDAPGIPGGRVKVLANGNVGIGTYSPFYKLHVNGDLRIETAFSMGGGNDFNIDAPGIPGGRVKVLANGNVGIGIVPTNSSPNKLCVNGRVAATDYAVVNATGFGDYVFANDYKLPTLAETEAYIKANKHLPSFKSAKEMEETGYTVVDMDKGLLKTIEEMTLHSIAQEKEITILKNEIAEIKSMLLAKK